MLWCATLPENSIHSLFHLVPKIDRDFKQFDCKALNKEALKIGKAPDKSFEQCYTCFCNIAYRFPKDDIDWEFRDGIFEYLLYISENPQFLRSLESCSYSSEGTEQS